MLLSRDSAGDFKDAVLLADYRSAWFSRAPLASATSHYRRRLAPARCDWTSRRSAGAYWRANGGPNWAPSALPSRRKRPGRRFTRLV